MKTHDMFLDSEQYYPMNFKKTTIYIHHTSGSHNPEYVQNGWNRDVSGKISRVATSYIVGGKSTRNDDTTWDGVILRCFPETQWAWHLGAKGTKGMFDKLSVGIEICNYGYLTKSKNGRFMTYVNTPVPEDQVVVLDKPFRGHKYYHKYTDEQISSVKEILVYLGSKFNIDTSLGLKEWIDKENLIIPNGLSVLDQQKWLNKHGFVGMNGKRLTEDGAWGQNSAWAVNSIGKSGFEYNPLTRTGYPGVWTHTNIRKDKCDAVPQPNLISMIKTL